MFAAGRAFTNELAEALEIAIEFEVIGDTCVLEAPCFQLSYVIETERFEIRKIQTYKKGLGKLIVFTIHEFCDLHGLSVCACHVEGTAIGFWQRLGYVEGDHEEFFRCT